MPWGAVASVAGAAISGAISSSGVSGAAGAAGGISQQAIANAGALQQANNATYQPFVDQGTAAETQQGNILGVNGSAAASSAMSNFTGSPGYSYALQQGERAVDAGAAAAGMGRSGATLKAEQTLGTNLADQNFNNYVGQLGSLASTGLQGAQGQANTTAAYDNVMSGQSTNQEQLLTGAATTNASIYGNAANGIVSGLGANSGSIAKLFGGSSTGTVTPPANTSLASLAATGF